MQVINFESKENLKLESKLILLTNADHRPVSFTKIYWEEFICENTKQDKLTGPSFGQICVEPTSKTELLSGMTKTFSSNTAYLKHTTSSTIHYAVGSVTIQMYK